MYSGRGRGIRGALDARRQEGDVKDEATRWSLGAVSARERREAEAFFAELAGTPQRARSSSPPWREELEQGETTGGTSAPLRLPAGFRLGVWLDVGGPSLAHSADEHCARLHELGVTDACIMINAVDDRSFGFGSVSEATIRAFAARLTGSAIRLTLTSWVRPERAFIDDLARSLPAVARSVGARAIELDVEEPWTRRRAVGLADHDAAADYLFAALAPARAAGLELAVTCQVDALPTAALRGVVRHADLIVPQAYSTFRADVRSHAIGGAYGPGGLQERAVAKVDEAVQQSGRPVVMGLASYRRTGWPGHTGRDIMEMELSRTAALASSAAIRGVRYWSWKHIAGLDGRGGSPANPYALAFLRDSALRAAPAGESAGEVAEVAAEQTPVFPDDLRQRRMDDLWRFRQEQQGGLITRCVVGTAVQRTEAEVRDAVVAAARLEWSRWHTGTPPAPITPRGEGTLALFGRLVGYWLSAIRTARPETLTAMQANAMAPTMDYGLLAAAGTPAATITTEVTRLRGLLFAGVAGTAGLAPAVDAALRQARGSHLDQPDSPWSAAWVTACVRGAAISLGIEVTTGGTHQGLDELLFASTAHRQYARVALQRSQPATLRLGTYHAFAPADRAPQPGDIIVQDRAANRAADVFRFASLATIGQLATHGDIIEEVTATHALTIGGNLDGGGGSTTGGSVRKRRYPLDPAGKLVVDAARPFEQEGDGGALDVLVEPIAGRPLGSFSTARIFTLVKLVPTCGAIPGQPYGRGVLT
jgi:hypothetical protein